MRFSMMLATVCAVLLLAACGHSSHEADMKASLDKLRAMVTQSALMTAQAACTESPARADIISAAAVMLRRVTAGPEMARLHRMMGGEMKMDESGGMAMSGGKEPESPQQAMHIAVHTASGKVFDLLDALSQPPGFSCADLKPVSLAAGAALLRQQHEEGSNHDEAMKHLIQEMDDTAGKLAGEVRPSINEGTPIPVREAAQALQKI